MLDIWRVGDCHTVGFEILASSLGDLFQEEGIHSQFPDKLLLLLHIREQRLTKLRPETLYKKEFLTYSHSLEVFHRPKDFTSDQVSHHKGFGSMMTSPSDGGFYLIRPTKWDNETEVCLREVSSNGYGKGPGVMSSTYSSINL